MNWHPQIAVYVSKFRVYNIWDCIRYHACYVCLIQITFMSVVASISVGMSWTLSSVASLKFIHRDYNHLLPLSHFTEGLTFFFSFFWEMFIGEINTPSNNSKNSEIWKNWMMLVWCKPSTSSTSYSWKNSKSERKIWAPNIDYLSNRKIILVIPISQKLTSKQNSLMPQNSKV